MPHDLNHPGPVHCEDISQSTWAELTMKYMLIFIFIIVVPLKLGPFLVYATTLAFLPLLEAPLKLTSYNCVQDSQ